MCETLSLFITILRTRGIKTNVFFFAVSFQAIVTAFRLAKQRSDLRFSVPFTDKLTLVDRSDSRAGHTNLGLESE